MLTAIVAAKCCHLHDTYLHSCRECRKKKKVRATRPRLNGVPHHSSVTNGLKFLDVIDRNPKKEQKQELLQYLELYNSSLLISAELLHALAEQKPQFSTSSAVVKSTLDRYALARGTPESGHKVGKRKLAPSEELPTDPNPPTGPRKKK